MNFNFSYELDMEEFGDSNDSRKVLKDSLNPDEQSNKWNYMTRNEVSVSINDSHCIVEDGKQQWKCHACSKIYTRKHSLITHIMSHAGIKPYSCTDCGKSFRQLAHLHTHMKIHQESKNYKCEYCGRCFAQMTHLKRHMLLHVDEKPYTCEVCSRGFAYPSELRKHLDKHREADECAECGKEVEPNKMECHMINRHIKAGNNYSLTCESCNLVFTYPSIYQEHIEHEHKDDLKFQCDSCSMKFLTESHLETHKMTRKNCRIHSCLVCGRTFTQKGNMERHMLIHNKDRHFECETCGKKFAQLQVLKMHQTSHSSAKPFTCSICGKNFARNINLKSHLALHVGKKPFKCTVCGCTFTMKGNLSRHQKEKHGEIIPTSEEKDSPKAEESDIGELGFECNEEFQAATVNESPELQDGSETVALGRAVKRRKGSPKRIYNSVSVSPSEPTPDNVNSPLVTNVPFDDLPNSPDKAGPSCSEPLPEEPSTSSIQAEFPINNSSFSPIANSDFLLSSGLSSSEILSSSYFGCSSSPSTFPHLPTTYPVHTAVSNIIYRPLAPLDISSRHNPSVDLAGNGPDFLSLADAFEMIPRSNESVGSKLQFVHGEIDKLVNKLGGYSSDKVNALHVAVNELAGLHTSLSPPFAESPGTYLT